MLVDSSSLNALEGKSPAVASWELARSIKRIRLNAKLEVGEIVTELEISPPYWSKLENDRATPSARKLDQILTLLNCPPAEADYLRELRAISVSPGWWSEYQDVLKKPVMRIFGLEAGAERVRAYEASIISGLVQSESYAREVIQHFVGNRAADVSRLVDARMERKEHLASRTDVQIELIMSESVLWQNMGELATLCGQLEHLLEISDAWENLDLRILPFYSPPRGAAGASTFFLLDFQSQDLSTVGWQESMFFKEVTDKPSEVRFLETCFTHLDEQALAVEESSTLIADVLQRLPEAHSVGIPKP